MRKSFINEMLFGATDSLRYVQRFSNCRRHVGESVAEHSYFVTLYTLFIVWWLERHSLEYRPDVGAALQGAVVHDLEEAVSGDFPRPFKYSTPELKAALDLAAVEAISTVAGTLGFSNPLQQVWEGAKDSGTLEGRVVEFADFLSSLAWLVREVEAGNVSVKDQASSTRAYANRFKEPEYNFVRPLVDQALVLVEGLNP